MIRYALAVSVAARTTDAAAHRKFDPDQFVPTHNDCRVLGIHPEILYHRCPAALLRGGVFALALARLIPINS